MANVHATIHLGANDVPHAWRMETGRICVWLDGPSGLSLVGPDEALAKLRDEINRALAPSQQQAA